MIIKGTADCIPEEAGYDSGRIAVLNGHFLRMMEKKEIEGAAYCISRRGKIIACNSMGTAHYLMAPETCGRIRFMESHPLARPLPRLR